MTNSKNVTHMTFCQQTEKFFSDFYLPEHGYIALAVCLLGSIANSVNIAVYSRKEMACSINFILLAISAADLLYVVTYIPYALQLYTTLLPSNYSYEWAVFYYFQINVGENFNIISIWLTVMVAVWRYIAIKFPFKSKSLCNKRNTIISIGLASAMCLLLYIPDFIFFQILEEPSTYSNETFHDLELNHTREYYVSFTLTEDTTNIWILYWAYMFCLQFVPCLMISILSVLLVLEMKSSDRKRKILLKELPSSNQGDIARLKNSQNVDRTTRMLIGVLGLFLATEFPLAIAFLGRLIPVHEDQFVTCFVAIGEFLDLLTLLGSAANIVVYCSMSQQFRSAFTNLIQK